MRAINAFLRNKKACALPDISRYPAVAVLIDEDQVTNSTLLNDVMKKYFVTKNCAVYAVNSLSENKCFDNVHYISKDSFGFWGLLKKTDITAFSSMHYDMLLNLVNDEENQLTDDYVMTVFDASFRVSFGKTCGGLYDLVLDTKKESMTDKIEVLCKYLLMLTGEK